ncbi:MAG: sugar-binding protein, partial [Lentisphaerota bacterium]
MKYILIISVILSSYISIAEVAPKVWGRNVLTTWTTPGWYPHNQGVSCNNEGGVNNLSIKLQAAQNSMAMQRLVVTDKVLKYRFSGSASYATNGGILTISAECRDIKDKVLKSETLASFSGQAAKKEFSREFEIVADSKYLSLYINQKSSTNAASEAILSALCMQKLSDIPATGIELEEIVPTGEHGLVKYNTPLMLEYKIYNPLNCEVNARVDLSLSDFYNTNVGKITTSMKLKPQILNAGKIDLPKLSKIGFYRIAGSIKCDNFESVTLDTAITIIPEPNSKADPFFGINGIIMSPDMGKAVRSINIGAVGLSIVWADLEKQKGHYNFTNISNSCDIYNSLGLAVIGQVFTSPVIWRSPDWVMKQIDARRKDGLPPFYQSQYSEYADFCEKLADNFKGRIKNWEYIEEIDLSIARDPFTRDNYIGRIKAATTRFKKLDPGCHVDGVGVSGVDTMRAPYFQISRTLWDELHQDLDGFAFDQYESPRKFGNGEPKVLGPELSNTRKILQTAVEIIKPYNKKLAAIGEKGYCIVSSLPAGSPYAIEMANILAQCLIVTKSVPEISHFLYFTCFSYPEGNADYGLWKGLAGERKIPRPAVAGFRTVADLLSFTRFNQKPKFNEMIICYVFDKESGGSVASIWSLNGNKIKSSIPENDNFKTFNLMGNEFDATNFELSGAPVFFVSKLTSDKLTEVLQQGEYSVQNLKGNIEIFGSNKFRYNIRNITSRKITGKLKITSPEPLKNLILPDFSLDPGEVESRSINLPATEFDAINDNEILIQAQLANGTEDIKGYSRHYYISNDKAVPSIITLKGPDNLFPVDAQANGLWKNSDDLDAKIGLSWDKDNLYFTATVKDDSFFSANNVGNLWQSDAFQIAIDTK